MNIWMFCMSLNLVIETFMMNVVAIVIAIDRFK